MKESILFLNNQEIKDLGGEDMQAVLHDCQRAYVLMEEGDVLAPTKCVMRWGKTPEDENVLGRINAMPGYIGGRFNMPGIKWDRQRSAESVQVRPAARLGRDCAERSRDQGTHCHHGRHTHQCDPHRRSNGRLRQVYGALALEDSRPFSARARSARRS